MLFLHNGFTYNFSTTNYWLDLDISWSILRSFGFTSVKWHCQAVGWMHLFPILNLDHIILLFLLSMKEWLWLVTTIEWVPHSQISNRKNIYFWHSQCLTKGPAVHICKNDGDTTHRNCTDKTSSAKTEVKLQIHAAHVAQWAIWRSTIGCLVFLCLMLSLCNKT